jgi:hypothetical protein
LAGLVDLSKEEKMGLHIFKGKGKCANCHLLDSDYDVPQDTAGQLYGGAVSQSPLAQQVQGRYRAALDWAVPLPRSVLKYTWIRCLTEFDADNMDSNRVRLLQDQPASMRLR